MGGKNQSSRTHVRVELPVHAELLAIAREMAKSVQEGRAEQTWENEGPPTLSHVVGRLVAFYRDYQRRRAEAGRKRRKAPTDG